MIPSEFDDLRKVVAAASEVVKTIGENKK